jgi:hypothetical protein
VHDNSRGTARRKAPEISFDVKITIDNRTSSGKIESIGRYIGCAGRFPRDELVRWLSNFMLALKKYFRKLSSILVPASAGLEK